MPVRERGQGESTSRSLVTSRLTLPANAGLLRLLAHTRGESRVFAPVGMEGTRETDSPLEGDGFEPSVPPERNKRNNGCNSRVSTSCHLNPRAKDRPCREEGPEVRILLPPPRSPSDWPGPSGPRPRLHRAPAALAQTQTVPSIPLCRAPIWA
jgi:hypothetical protein